MQKIKKLSMLVIISLVLLVACGSSDSVSNATSTSTDYTPVIGYDFNSSSKSNVEITSDSDSSTIKYTTDGSTPSATNGTTYSGSFSIDSSTSTVKAVSILNGEEVSDVVSKDIPIGTMPVTIMYYGDGDNSLDNYLREDVAEMKAGYSRSGYNLITLFDGSSSSTSSTGFGEAFTDTRLYKIGENSSTRLSGSSSYLSGITSSGSCELDMGDANTLKEFIDYCKENYPADKYMLIISNHGGGSKSVVSIPSKDICQDVTSSNDVMYTGEITDMLTDNESIDVLTLDACLMGTVEFGYQFRTDNNDFNSKYLVASPAEVWAYGLPYTDILERLSFKEGNNGDTSGLNSSSEDYIDTTSSNFAKEFSKMIVEEQYDSLETNNYLSSQAFSAYDLGNMTALKTAIDNFAKSIVSNNEETKLENVRGSTYNIDTAMNYLESSTSYYWLYYPFFDVYDIARYVKSSSSFGSNTKTYANNIISALSSVIISSFGGSDFFNANDKIVFANGYNGISIVFPKNTVTYNNTSYKSMKYLYWYTPTALNSISNVTTTTIDGYGSLEFCDGGTENDSTISNWFEMIDYWYDDTSINSGKGYNYYQSY